MMRTLQQQVAALAVVAVVCVAAASATRVTEEDDRAAGIAALPHLNVDASTVTVSGFSSGGDMAHQLHIAHSTFFYGASVGGVSPWYCAHDNPEWARTVCLSHPALISVKELSAIAWSSYETGVIDNPKALARSKVLIYSGKLDSIVVPDVVRKTEALYRALGATQIRARYSLPAQHAVPTKHYGNKCDTLGSPFINKCDYSLAEDTLDYFYGPLKPRGTAVAGNLHEFAQREFSPAIGPLHMWGLAETGFIYVPTACQNSKKQCRLTMNLHGCQQSEPFISHKDYVVESGLLEWAEANDIVVVFPAATKNELNPYACWDWWGYTGTAFASKLGVQVVTLKRMLDRVLGQF